MAENIDENNNQLTSLEKLAAKLLQKSTEELNLEEIEKFAELKFAPIPSGVIKRKTKRASCTQWSWAKDKYKSSIMLGDNSDSSTSSISSSPKRYLKYPRSHQHKSKALDFGAMVDNNLIDNPKSQYKDDYKTNQSDSVDKPQQELLRKCSKTSSHDKKSLSGTNVRETKTKNCSEVDENQQRWTLKILEKKTPLKSIQPAGHEETEKEKQEPLSLSPLSTDDDKMTKKEETELEEKAEKSKNSKHCTRPF